MATPKRGDEVLYRTWNGRGWDDHVALVRVPPASRHAVASLVYDDTVQVDDVPNVESFATPTDLLNQSFWQQSRVEPDDGMATVTTIPEVNDSVWLALWNGTDGWDRVSAIVASIGTGASPMVSLIYIDDSGSRVGLRNVVAAENAPPRGNYWVNRPAKTGER